MQDVALLHNQICLSCIRQAQAKKAHCGQGLQLANLSTSRSTKEGRKEGSMVTCTAADSSCNNNYKCDSTARVDGIL
jgi:hypothetical protein